MAALSELQMQAIGRITAAAANMERAAELMREAVAEMQIAVAELEPHQALDFELIAIDAIVRARTKED